jgi:hypothetical protein
MFFQGFWKEKKSVQNPKKKRTPVPTQTSAPSLAPTSLVPTRAPTFIPSQRPTIAPTGLDCEASKAKQQRLKDLFRTWVTDGSNALSKDELQKIRKTEVLAVVPTKTLNLD